MLFLSSTASTGTFVFQSLLSGENARLGNLRIETTDRSKEAGRTADEPVRRFRLSVVTLDWAAVKNRRLSPMSLKLAQNKQKRCKPKEKNSLLSCGWQRDLV